LAEIWDTKPLVDERIGEISILPEDPGKRAKWLQKLIGEKWSNLNHDLNSWRRSVMDTFCEIEENSVIFSHSIAINVAVGEATGDDRVVCFWPENGSVTTIDVNGSVMNLIQRGFEDTTKDWRNINI
jgi:broad specificity phosphatase PhoE